MKKLLLFILFSTSLHSIYSQSSIKFRSNLFRFNDEYPTKKKIGFGIGHEKITLSHNWVKLIWAQSLDYKQTNFNYQIGGLGHGKTLIIGNIHLLNAQLDTKVRLGKRLFYDIGGFIAFSIVKELKPADFANYKNYFNSFDGGILTGIGYSFENITLSVDMQIGLFKILQSNGTQYKTQQLNLSTVIPFEKFKRIK